MGDDDYMSIMWLVNWKRCPGCGEREWIYRFVPAPAGASRAVLPRGGTPDLPFAGLQSALGSLPSVALSSAGANVGGSRESSLFKVGVSRFRFPGGL
jgi:hypothetical protein